MMYCIWNDENDKWRSKSKFKTLRYFWRWAKSFQGRYNSHLLRGELRLVLLVCWLVGWLVCWVFFWKTAPTIFLIFGMKFLLDKWKKVTEPFFPGKIWIIQKFGSFKNFFFCELSDSDSKNAKKKKFTFWSKMIWNLTLSRFGQKRDYFLVQDALKVSIYWSSQWFELIRKYSKMKLWQQQQQQQQ